MRRRLLPALALAAAAAAGFACPDSEDLGPIPVKLKTADGVTIHGWYIHAGEHEGERAHRAEEPAVVLLHMYGGDRHQWRSLISPLRERGVASLMIDMRGHGESAEGPGGEDLARRMRERDPALFQAMWQDALAAVAWLEQEGHVAGRIGLLGASVGASVAVDAARRDPRLQVVGLLTPGTSYLGVPTLEHLEAWGRRHTLIVSSEEEAGKGADAIHALIAKQEGSRPEYWRLREKDVHGTRMLGGVEGMEERLAEWFAARLGAPDPEAAGSPGPEGGQG